MAKVPSIAFGSPPLTGLISNTVTEYPAFRIFMLMGFPITPRPMKPMNSLGLS
jgi:hypothetical protein